MAQEIETRMRTIRAELTRLVRDGQDEEGIALRCLLAELDRLENQRLALRSQAAEPPVRPAMLLDDRMGRSHARLIA
jgi:hypothetical protein